ncbi:hypothetical protein [Candidatus Reidiella endopervernicosa]|uniref:hypothetical protein n=1 Tax=Candidatus Reidiella endopervernicosa TaxID=2738883 RepID=UPI001F2996A1|nr:hypothetical protein [Candidatus Reidiella endopervernicosa]
MMLARCCQMNGVGHLYSLENGADYAEKSRSEIARYELSEYADVIDAPLETSDVGGDPYQWYAQADILKHQSICW